mgnify:CR=1 FL=1
MLLSVLLPLPGLELAFNIDLTAFVEVLGAVLCLLAPDHDLVPLRPLLLVSRLVFPALICRNREVCDGLPIRQVLNFRLLSQIPNNDDLIDRHTDDSPYAKPNRHKLKFRLVS